jgi:hypothetical protein
MEQRDTGGHDAYADGDRYGSDDDDADDDDDFYDDEDEDEEGPKARR